MLRTVARDSAMPLRHAAQIALNERDVGGFHRDVGSGSHRDSHVGLRQCGRVVDAVADHRHALAFALQFLDFAGFLGGQNLSHHALDSKFARNGVRGFTVVAGEHRDFQSEVLKLFHRVNRTAFQWVGDG
jgi:hypothetical protein